TTPTPFLLIKKDICLFGFEIFMVQCTAFIAPYTLQKNIPQSLNHNKQQHNPSLSYCHHKAPHLPPDSS
ncbi:MAG: hypothetical protein KAT90_04000, partial [Gammaproteobacteria bacterium]|nr:hypothetical protein [Gammaproteobacteria bacterium]